MKQLRKDDGYILVYVLVVFLVLSFAAVAICTGAVQNLRAQQASIVRTQALYEAEGRVEEYIAKVCMLKSAFVVEGEDSVESLAQETFRSAVLSPEVSVEDVTEVAYDGAQLLTFKAHDSANCVQIDVQVKMQVLYQKIGEEESSTYQLSGVTVSGYDKYDISYFTGGDAG